MRWSGAGSEGREPTVGVDPLRGLGERAARGDAMATRLLLEKLSPTLLGVVRSMLGPAHPDVEDAVQEALVGFVGALAQFRGECGVRHFACRIAVRASLSVRRRTRAQRERLEVLQRTETAGIPDRISASDLLAMRRRELMRGLLDSLPREQAESLALRVVLGMSLEEVAEATGAPLNTVRSRLRLAKTALAKRIQADPSLAEELEAR